MKKRLEAELISIAHRVLKLKNKSEVDQLYKETQKLYETLSVLKFYQDNFESVKSEVAEDVLEEKLEESNKIEETPGPIAEEKNDIVEAVADAEPEVEEEEETKPETQFEEQEVVQPESEQEVAVALADEEILEEAEEEVADEKPSFEPIFELEVEEAEEEQIIPAEVASEIQPEEKLEDHIGKYADPVFVKPNEVSLFPSESSRQVNETTAEESKNEENPSVSEEAKQTPKPTVSDTHSKSIAIGLNDRIGFVQHLFNDSNEDFNRVISQLNTFDTFEEAKNFINEMVIPDYNYWVGEEDYIERFMAIVEKKFQ